MAAKKVATKKTKVKSKTSSKPKKKQAKKTMSAGHKITVGNPVPSFAAPITGGKKFSLSEMKGKKIVLYFYPRDATPGCTIEGHDFTKLHSAFQKSGAEVFGISRDPLSSHEKFKAKECYSIDLISDEDGKICQVFDVIKEKNMYGKKVMGIERSTFVIDSDGRLIKEWRKVKVDGHAQEVLSYLKENS